MSLAHFLSFCRGQTGGTPVGFTVWKMEKKKKITFLFLACFVPPFQPYLAKVKEIFTGIPLSQFTAAACGLVSQVELSCRN